MPGQGQHAVSAAMDAPPLSADHRPVVQNGLICCSCVSAAGVSGGQAGVQRGEFGVGQAVVQQITGHRQGLDRGGQRCLDGGAVARYAGAPSIQAGPRDV
jgi:hypothetical protein